MQQLLIRKLSHFHVSPVVKAYIIADTTLWAAWNLVTPIFALFVVTGIKRGNVEVAASGYSIYLISRVIFELMSAKLLVRSNDKKKFALSIIGMLSMSIAYIGFAFSSTIFEMFFFYAVIGLGLGLATPAKSALYATHLDKEREATEWGITDAVGFICMAIATTLGGIVAKMWGFSMLFLMAAIVNLLGTLPYFSFMPWGKTIYFQVREES